MQIVLASGSPRRKELLKMLGIDDFVVMPACGEEKPTEGAGPGETVTALSEAKAREVAGKVSGESLVIAADTIVWLEGRILGKPKSDENAAEMLRSLSGRTHEVYTGVTVIKNGTVCSEYEVTSVCFRDISEEEIASYVKTGEPSDKAGAYAAQGLASLFVKKIDGDFFNVMGLPVCRLGEMLKKQGVRIL